MKPLPEVDTAPAAPEPADEKVRVSRANAEARIAPTREGYVNAIQVWPFTDGALYQVYAAPGRVTVVSLQPGEELVTVAAGDTVRWIVGDTSSGSGDALRVNVLVKPIRSGLKTNLVITTSRRTYLLELTSTEKAWMASVSRTTRKIGCWPCSAAGGQRRRAGRYRLVAGEDPLPLRGQRQQSAVEAAARLR